MNTGEKIASAGFSNSIVENLERRFAVLEQCKHVYNFTGAEREYIDYLEREKQIHTVLKSLAADGKNYDVMTHVIFVLSIPSEGQPEAIKFPSFLNGSQFKDISWETIKAAEMKRRVDTNEAARDAVVGCGSRERADIIWTDITLQGRIFLTRKLHYDLTERLTGEIDTNNRAGTKGKDFNDGSRAVESIMVSSRATKPIKRLISKDALGSFFYHGELITLRLTNIAYDLLDILYSHFPTGGFLTYKEIEDELRRRGKGNGSSKSIQNALGDGQGFFGIAKVGRAVILRRNPDGKELIEIVRGKGLQFNNPPI
jgi:hypothetical protein